MGITDHDKNLCIATAHVIINEYIHNVILTGEYKGNSTHFTLPPKEQAGALLGLLCQTITKIERINNSQYPALTITKLSEYLQQLPQSSYHEIGTYRSSDISDSDTLQEIFDELSNYIHTMLPFYKGFRYEHPYILNLFSF